MWKQSGEFNSGFQRRVYKHDPAEGIFTPFWINHMCKNVNSWQDQFTADTLLRQKFQREPEKVISLDIYFEHQTVPYWTWSEGS